MAKKAQLTESLPKLAVTPLMRQRIERIADAAEVSMADIQRDCIENTLLTLEIQVGVVTLDDLEETQLVALGLPPAPPAPVREDRSIGCWGK